MTPGSSDQPTPATDGAEPLRKTLAQLRERLGQQESRVTEVFAGLRDDMSRLAQQVDSVAQAAAARTAADRDKSGPPDDEDDPLGFIDAPARSTPARTSLDRVAVMPGAKMSVSSSASAAAGVAGDDATPLEQLIFGPELSARDALGDERQQLVHDMSSGSTAAMGLAGAILLFRSATAERMPQLLKDIGEAWYSWRPETADAADALRDELTGFLQRKCDEAGVPNVIELVRPGDRYDSKRHHARQPGVEVVGVGGWVVLRDNGKVYTKAAVTVK